MADFFDLALVFDPATRRCDLQLGDDADLLIDETPATPMLISFGSDRRARLDDELPSGISELNQPVSFVERRGWAGDALDIAFRQIGSRLWLLERAKANEITRRMAEEWMKEAFAWVEEETGKAAKIEVTWVRPQMLGIVVVADGRPLRTTQRVGGA
ncbi:phage GP46 family protein [Ancylobacter defluvii]|uniref:Phage gp46-like protein n=1 Tax=Ancylobacter defluvii TaxID=1282440 RepID=A0A9W6K0D2_9HYPH|nr:phage GP46 family protein [Ancylobacter defluvii]MBS7586398.1 phage GP46 family protein [Ancylobacter defluvii]GLK85679.1 hypothetical protein GCM10017653_37490 [Ancylobacter defluvii]